MEERECFWVVDDDDDDALFPSISFLCPPRVGLFNNNKKNKKNKKKKKKTLSLSLSLSLSAQGRRRPVERRKTSSSGSKFFLKQKRMNE